LRTSDRLSVVWSSMRADPGTGYPTRAGHRSRARMCLRRTIRVAAPVPAGRPSRRARRKARCRCAIARRAGCRRPAWRRRVDARSGCALAGLYGQLSAAFSDGPHSGSLIGVSPFRGTRTCLSFA
jgi:hypothetical protein